MSRPIESPHGSSAEGDKEMEIYCMDYCLQSRILVVGGGDDSLSFFGYTTVNSDDISNDIPEGISNEHNDISNGIPSELIHLGTAHLADDSFVFAAFVSPNAVISAAMDGSVFWTEITANSQGQNMPRDFSVASTRSLNLHEDIACAVLAPDASRVCFGMTSGSLIELQASESTVTPTNLNAGLVTDTFTDNLMVYHGDGTPVVALELTSAYVFAVSHQNLMVFSREHQRRLSTCDLAKHGTGREEARKGVVRQKKTVEPVSIIEHTPTCISVSASGSLAAVGDLGRGIRVFAWNGNSLHPVFSFSVEDAVETISFFGGCFVWGGFGNTVGIVDPIRGTVRVCSLPRKEACILRILNGRHLAVNHSGNLPLVSDDHGFYALNNLGEVYALSILDASRILQLPSREIVTYTGVLLGSSVCLGTSDGLRVLGL